MSWSYSGDPQNSPLDQVRFLIGDTNSSVPLLSDEEILYLLNRENNNIYAAAYYAAKAIVAKLSREYDQSVGAVRYSLSQRVKQYETLASNLKLMFESNSAVPYCGGISVSDKESREEDTDRVEPIFFRDLHDDKTIDKNDKTDIN